MLEQTAAGNCTFVIPGEKHGCVYRLAIYPPHPPALITFSCLFAERAFGEAAYY